MVNEITSVILVRGARQLVTLRGSKAPRRGPELNQLSIIPDGSLLVRDGIVREVGPTRRIENLAEARKATEIDATGRVVMPGFVDSHTHLLYSPPELSCADLASAVRALEGSTAIQLKLRAGRELQAMARHGTTTVEVKTGSASEMNTELKMLRVLAELRQGPLDVVPTFLFRPRCFGPADPGCRDRWKQVGSDWLPRICRQRLSEFADLVWTDSIESLWDSGMDLAAWYDGYFEIARSLGIRCKLHADTRYVAAAAIAALRYHVATIDHLEYATERDISALSRSDLIATLLPAVSFHAGRPYAPGRELIDSGVALALATNFHRRETPTLSMQTVVALACKQMNFTPAEALTAATINGAYALDRGHTAGSLEIGKTADVLFLNVSDYRELAHCLGTNLVQTVMKRGEIIYREGQVEPHPLQNPEPAW